MRHRPGRRTPPPPRLPWAPRKTRPLPLLSFARSLRLRVVTASLVVLLSLATHAAAAHAQTCVARPDLSASQQYCEEVPSAGGGTAATPAGGGGATTESLADVLP